MKITVLIPTKNEPLINKLIEDVHGNLSNFEHEIIVIDKSDVKPKIKNAKLVLQKSDGLGKAVLEGLKHVKGNIIVTMDGDGSHDPKYIPKLIKKLKEYDIAIGSRFVFGGKTEDVTHRKIISEIFRKLASFILNLNVKDSMSGFVAVRKKVYDSLQLDPVGYKINMEILYKAKKLGFRTAEVPIVFKRRKAGKTKAGILEGLKTIIFIFKLRLGI